MTSLITIRRAAATSAIAAVFAVGGVAAAHSPSASVTGQPGAGPQGECDWVDPAAVAALPVGEAADELDELSTFSAAIAASDLDDQLADDGPFTVFAPSNQAIDEIPDNVFDSMIADLDFLESILGYHVVVGQSLSPEQLAAAATVDTLSGQLTVTQEGDTFVINGGEATVTCAGIVTANATIYVIDHVLQPAADSMCPTGSSVPGSSVPGSSVPASSVPGSSIPC